MNGYMRKFIAILSVFALVSCDIVPPDNPQDSKIPVVMDDQYFDGSNNISGEAYETAGAQTIMRALELCYSMQKVKVTVGGKSLYYSMPSAVDEQFIDDFYSSLQQLAYSSDYATKGVWSIGKSSIDWYKAVKNVDKLYRCAIVGAVTENFNKDQMVDLYNSLMKHKTEIFRDWLGMKYVSAAFEAENFSTAGRFWYHFSHGDLDNYAKRIYNIVFNPQTVSDCFVMTDALHELAFQLAANDLSPDRLMLSAAGPLIEAGFNTLFAADDVAGSAKLGYDILNDNTQLIIDIKNKKLNTKTLMSAVNNNLNLLATCIDKVVGFDNLTGIKDTQDLGSLITGFCVENGLDVTLTIKELNDAISGTLTDMGRISLTVGDVFYETFEAEVKRILGLDSEFECPVVSMYCAVYTSNGGRVIPPDFDFTTDGRYWEDVDRITVSRVDDKTLHFEASYTDTYEIEDEDGSTLIPGTYTDVYEMYFDLENFNYNKPEQSVITNFFVSHEDRLQGSSRYSYINSVGRFQLGIERLPYKELNNHKFSFGGTVSSGVVVTGFLDRNENEGSNYESKYYSHNDNYFEIYFDLNKQSKD